MKRVLITRPQPGALETAGRLVALGFEPVLAPVMSIAYHSLIVPSGIAATVLTSRNAIPGCPPALYGSRVFAVGAATAAAAAAAGFREVLSADGDALALVRLISEASLPSAGALFLPTAEGQGLDLAATLRQHGFRVARRVAYRTVAVDAMPEHALAHFRQQRLGSALFFSGETARCFITLLRAAARSDVALLDTVRHVEAVSISERAAWH